MLDDKTIVLVINRYDGTVGYGIPEMNGLYRRYAPGEGKKVTMGELRKLSYQTGGDYIIRNYLTIQNEEAVAELVGDVPPEYYYTPKQVENLLILGTVDELDDCLTFAPSGVVDLIKDIATKVKLNDMNKRQLIAEKTGFDVDKAIRNNAYADAVEEDKPQVEKRKAAAPAVNLATEVPQRKTAAPKYKVTSISK